MQSETAVQPTLIARMDRRLVLLAIVTALLAVLAALAASVGGSGAGHGHVTPRAATAIEYGL